MCVYYKQRKEIPNVRCEQAMRLRRICSKSAYFEKRAGRASEIFDGEGL